MITTTAAKPRLRKAVKSTLPAEIKTAFVCIPRFMPADLVMTKLREVCSGVELKAYADIFTSMKDWLKRRRQVIEQHDALIVALGPKRNAPGGVVREIQHALQS